MRVSTYIIGRNCAHTLAEALDSVVGQSRPPDEIVYVDDASDDDSIGVAGRYAMQHVRVLRNARHLGIRASRNRAVEVCSGDWVAVLDADDIWMPDKLQKQFAHLSRDPSLCALGGAATIIDAAGEEMGAIHCPTSDRDIKDRELIHNCFVHSTLIFRRDLFLELGGYRDLAPAEDYDLLLRMSERGRLHNLDEPLAFHRISFESQSYENRRRLIAGARAAKAQARARRGKRIPASIGAMALLRSVLAPILFRSPYIHWGVHQLVLGDAEHGRTLLRKAASPGNHGQVLARVILAIPAPMFRGIGRLLKRRHAGAR